MKLTWDRSREESYQIDYVCTSYVWGLHKNMRPKDQTGSWGLFAIVSQEERRVMVWTLKERQAIHR